MMKKKPYLPYVMAATMAVGSAGYLAGCSGGSGGIVNPLRTVQAAQTTPIGNGVGRGFVTLRGTVPVSLGFTLTPGALTGLPAGPAPAQFLVALPPEASQYTPFQLIGIAYFTASTPPGLGNVPAHFSPLILINQPQAADPPNFERELAPVAPAELAKDHVYVDQFVPGLGASYDDPAQPQRKPNWNSTGQNYFYYDGHMNGYGLGATIPFLESKATRTDAIKQPQLYPKPGYYAFRHSVSYNSTTNLYTVELTDFRYEDASHSITVN
ncbi:hypothetical protein IAD21_00473 [Abditibacteriota bacterium]|nr:hypothetical protein IAD21_00473 [Abditibacteriota bacterium]